MEAYTDFAGVYDIFMEDTPYEEWADFLEDLIKKYGISKPLGERKDFSNGEGNLTLAGTAGREDENRMVQEEALETEEDQGVLEDMLDEVVEASEDVTDLTEELAEMEEETEKQKENLEQTENLTEESQDVPKGKGALAKLSEEIQEIEEEKQQAVEEEKLAARQARNLEAYQTVDRRYRYQAMDLKV